METIYRDYSPRGVKFFNIYKSLAHPETNGYVTPFTLEERLMHVKEAQRRLGSEIPWLCDTMSNDLKHALGDAPNSEFVIDPQGNIARRRAWSDPRQLRKDLEELIGPVESPTKVSDVEVKKITPLEIAPKGVVKRVKAPGRMKPLKIKPKPSKQPYYAKLRAEVDEQFLKTGKGKMYIGFHLDPLYHVHWNNLADPLQYELKPPPGAEVSPASGKGPKLKAESDMDPREFLLDIVKGDAKEPMQLTVRYFACNSEEGWCAPVTQQYEILMELDSDGGWVSQRFRRPGAGRPTRVAAGRRASDSAAGRSGPLQRGGRPNIIARIKANDKNSDGKITKDEASERLKRFFSRIDSNGDDVIDESEIRSFAQRRPQRRRPNPRQSLRAQTKPAPTHKNVAYGPHERNVLDFWQAEGAEPTPLVLFIHGGGFRAGSKEKLSVDVLRDLLKAGISVAAINYRLIQQAPLPAAHHDARRALQFLRSKAKEWNIDKQRVGAFGGSAGAQICMWLAFHDEMGDPESADPVERESTRLTCVATNGGQTTMDFDWWKKWIPGYETPHRDPSKIFGVKTKEEYLKTIEEISALSLISKDDPPIFMSYGMAPDAPVPANPQRARGWKIHHVMFGIKLKEKMDELGVEADLKYPGARTTYRSIPRFFITKLTKHEGGG